MKKHLWDIDESKYCPNVTEQPACLPWWCQKKRQTQRRLVDLIVLEN